DLVRLSADLGLHDLDAGVRGGLEVGLKPDVVTTRDDRPGQAMAVHVAPLSERRRPAPVHVDKDGPRGSHPRGASKEDTIRRPPASCELLHCELAEAISVDAATGRA